jgi:proton-dependent oligopeptide transporter, POT family
LAKNLIGERMFAISLFKIVIFMLKNHPKGLPFLFFTEMWERFGYYLMIGIFFLYMTDVDKGGLGFERKNAADMYGTFIALVYLTPFIGGMVADRLLGYRKSIILGALLMAAGYLMLALPGKGYFYGSLGLMILGNGFFKPNISVLLGNLYNEPKYASLKDTGYSIFYMGINIGAFICNFIAAYLRNNYGWGYAFAAAGVGMLIGVLVFVAGMKHYAHADVKKEAVKGEAGLGAVLSSVLLPALVTGIAGWMIPGTLLGSDSTDAFVLGSVPIVAFYLYTLYTAPAEEKRQIKALLSIYLVVIAFWAVFKQNGTALTTWAEYYTDRSVPTAFEPIVKASGSMQEIDLATKSYPVYDAQFRTSKDTEGNVIKAEGQHPYFKNLGEVPPNDGTSLKTVSTEIFQSINPFFVIVLTPLLILFFNWLRNKRREPTTVGKMTWGLFISALSNLIMVWAVFACHNGADKASSWYMIATYAVVTIGELCISPMGLSTVSKLAPPRITGLMMGGWQLATSLGNKLSGVLATLWDGYDNKANFFYVNIVLLLGATLALFALLKWLNQIFEERGLR